MTDLFNRDVLIRVGGIEIATRDLSIPSTSDTHLRIGREPLLRVAFRIDRASKKDPNTADVQIYNLNKVNRAKLDVPSIPVEIEAGYIGTRAIIFSGDLTHSRSTLNGTDWITTIQSGDGSDQFKKARINKSFKGPIKIGDALKEVAKEMGLPIGNLNQVLSGGEVPRSALVDLINGFVASGKTELSIDKITKAMGLDWSIQNKKMQFLGTRSTIPGRTIPLRSDTGLVGTPEVNQKKILKARSLMQPDLVPGRRIDVQTQSISGQFRVEKTSFVGDTWGNDWYVDIEAKRI